MIRPNCKACDKKMTQHEVKVGMKVKKYWVCWPCYYKKQGLHYGAAEEKVTRAISVS
jgi:hypothetical protein